MKKITYGFADTEFGQIVLGQSGQGLCWLGFMAGGYKGDGLSRMKAFYKDAEFSHDDAVIEPLAEQVMNAWAQERLSDIPLDLNGTPFQISVWNALLKVKRGAPKTYGEIANDIGKPKAVRAVGSAVGENPVSLIVPCHRVVPKSGGVGNYGWGAEIKSQLLNAEAATA